MINEKSVGSDLIIVIAERGRERDECVCVCVTFSCWPTRSVHCLSECPKQLTAMPDEKSRYSFPSASQRMQPFPFTKEIPTGLAPAYVPSKYSCSRSWTATDVKEDEEVGEATLAFTLRFEAPTKYSQLGTSKQKEKWSSDIVTFPPPSSSSS